MKKIVHTYFKYHEISQKLYEVRIGKSPGNYGLLVSKMKILGEENFKFLGLYFITEGKDRANHVDKGNCYTTSKERSEEDSKNYWVRLNKNNAGHITNDHILVNREIMTWAKEHRLLPGKAF